jgi:hypothetical protein
MQVFHTVYGKRKPYTNETKACQGGQQEKIVFSADGSVSSQPADLS